MDLSLFLILQRSQFVSSLSYWHPYWQPSMHIKTPLSHCHALRCYNQPGQPSTVQAHWEAAGSAASLFSTGAAVHRVGERTTCPCWAVTNISIFGQPAWDTLIDGVDHDSWWKHPDSRFDTVHDDHMTMRAGFTNTKFPNLKFQDSTIRSLHCVA